MPDMDGATLAARIREAGHTLPLVLFSSLGRREAADSLFAATLAKPLRQSQLFDTLVTLLAQDEVRLPAPARGQAEHRRHAGRRATRCASCWPRTTWSTRSWRLRLLQQMGYRADRRQQRHRGRRML